MSDKGYFLIEILITLFLLSLITIIVLPLIQNSSYYFMQNKRNIEMGFLGEKVLEQLKALNKMSTLEGYILDIELSELVCLLGEAGDIVIKLPFNEENQNNTTDYPYKVIITKKDIDKKLWKVKVKVKENSERKRSNDIVYETYMVKYQPFRN